MLKRSLFPILCLALAMPAFAAEETMQIATGKAKFNGLLQTWFLTDSSNPSVANNFRVRRTELKFSGSVVEHSRWFIMVDVAKTLSTGPISQTNDNKILQDIGVAWIANENFEMIIGQMKNLTSAE